MILSTRIRALAGFAWATLTMAAAPAQAAAGDGGADAADVAAVPMSATLIDAAALPANDAQKQFSELFASWTSLDRQADPDGPVRIALPETVSAPFAPYAVPAIPSLMPVGHARMSSSYGMRTHPVLGRRQGHKGIDLAAPTGTPIYATADGTVSRANRFSSYGNYVSIEHDRNMQTRYAHMSVIAVAKGERVRKGDIIGYVGSTGRSTGPHLHYEVRIGGVAVDPAPYMHETLDEMRLAMATSLAPGGSD